MIFRVLTNFDDFVKKSIFLKKIDFRTSKTHHRFRGGCRRFLDMSWWWCGITWKLGEWPPKLVKKFLQRSCSSKIFRTSWVSSIQFLTTDRSQWRRSISFLESVVEDRMSEMGGGVVPNEDRHTPGFFFERWWSFSVMKTFLFRKISKFSKSSHRRSTSVNRRFRFHKNFGDQIGPPPFQIRCWSEFLEEVVSDQKILRKNLRFKNFFMTLPCVQIFWL